MTDEEVAASTRLGLAVRVPVFTMVTTGLGVGAHLLGGGRPPSCALLALTLLVVALVWRVTARTEQSLPQLTGGVLGLQFAIHLALSTSTGAAQAAQAAQAAHAAHAAQIAQAAQAGHTTVLMWPAHGLAAVAVAWWLRRGEAATWRAVRRAFARFVTAQGDALLPSYRLPTRVDVAGDARPDPVLLLLGPRWRGPPTAVPGPSLPLARHAVPY